MTNQNQLKLKRVLIMAGGTGGHVFPGLALAKHLLAQGIEVHWLGTEHGLELQLVSNVDIPLHLVTISGLRGKGFKSTLTAPFKITRAIIQSMKHIKRIKPDIVVGMGGFVSGPGGCASWLLRRPLVIHEQNASAGLTNKLLKPLAKRVLLGFPSVFPAQSKVVFVGNPVRSELSALSKPEDRLQTATSFRLLVLGGSLGARAINEVVPKALALLNPAERPIVTHQTGDKHLEQTKANYQTMGVEAHLTPFISDMAYAYAHTDMVLCRAGALTVAELCAVGLGSILVPFPFAADDHQTMNAHFLVEKHAAVCVQQQDLSAKQLANLLGQFARSPQQRLAMAAAAYEARCTCVTEKICQILHDITEEV
jgi:UDP-N-acetylglucosamine--N-acetylmuramyl-(pentapeptide) pyrophosphoryl-undecaprenol N-acetylglucosamine transferase